jgi:hypothetical protein
MTFSEAFCWKPRLIVYKIPSKAPPFSVEISTAIIGQQSGLEFSADLLEI